VTRQELADALREAGVAARRVEIDGWSPGGIPQDGALGVWPEGDEWVVGGVEYGAHIPHERFRSQDAAFAHLLEELRRPLPESDGYLEPRPDSATAQRLAAWVDAHAADGGPLPYVPQVGDRFDRFGYPDGAHQLFVEGTPYPQRSLPPTNLDEAEPNYGYHLYEVTKPWSAEAGGVRMGRVRPWFEQPGGGVKLVFDRSVRWLLEHGYLTERRVA
jgi:hypothetical protein